jgi:KaiC/GvpD/RAD55 family RecA-like ATPase
MTAEATEAELAAARRLLGRAERNGQDADDVGEPEDGASLFFVNWQDFWRVDRQGPAWLVEEVLAMGRGHALYAPAKTGKSLLALWLALQALAAGAVVLYFDYEMSGDDLHERLEAMGVGQADDLSRLRYAILPALPALDTADGGAALLALVDEAIAAHPGAPVALVIDTTGRAVKGEENDAATIQAFHRWTGTGLRRRGVTWARLDHAGKDPTRGQRGSSAKAEDVDLVWRMARTENGLRLRREMSRVSWAPESVNFRQLDDPLRFVRVDEDWPLGTVEVARVLDGLGVDPSAGERPAGAALREAGHKATNVVVRAAQKWRRRLADERLRGAP